MLNKYPAWKYWLLLAILTVGLIYSAPNLFGEDPAVQVLPSTGRTITKATKEQIEKALAEAEIPFKSIKQENESLLIRFKDTPQQIKAKDIIYDELGDNYIVALNLAPKTPAWLEALGAKPMKLGLDLRGGVHFLMEVDVDSAITRRMEGFIGDIRTDLRDEKIRYRQIAPSGKEAINLYFDDREMLNKALTHLQKRFGDFDFLPQTQDGKMQITCQLKPAELQNIRNYTLEQTLSTLRNRVNELGVAEAVVQRQGANHIVVELPGIQDTARAKDILGKTATLEFHLHAKEESAKAVPGRQAPPGTKWYYDRNGHPQLLKKRVILTGDSITGASVGADDRSGRPAVLVRVGGAGLPLFRKTTIENVGNLLAVVYIETKTEQENVDGQMVKKNKTLETLISIATIQSALGSQFQITGFTLPEAQDLSLLLRAGALPASIQIVEERTVGPSLGQENIRLGILSIEVGLGLVVIGMMLYYSIFGIIANLALLINVVLLVAILSVMGATLTLPGMAGIVLTVGMAVDANVLIFERIREELRHGMSVQAAIHSGFDRALATIIDSNLTTLIVVIILFCIGTGPIKGFAVTTSIGIVTSMITAVTCTRAMVNLAYGRRSVKHLPIGI
ncbi:protein translocase subunit SecD [Candidatus Berkiella aquae]|uniref:Protein translocase subunit SecD n=1 Tax=Candidatus Berkiella aquae TaxID=295108 RepID=A0A0Q9YVE4_9GAMM|nr:protein translocase subunit SecD [Candidatus Berkiella aquae]MCS5711017.1 protein translocase subunit SecD [Candidatus Berkiella aquae]